MIYKVLSPGKKIKYYRDLLKLTQKKIKGKLNQSIISNVERGDEILTPHVASIVAERINYYAKQKGIDINITADFLLKDIETQIKDLIEETTCELKNITVFEEFKNSLVEVEDFIDIYTSDIDPNIKYKIYESIYEKFYEFKDFYGCRTYTQKCLEISYILQCDSAKLILFLTRVNIYLNDPQSAIAWGKTISNKRSNDVYSIRNIHFNIAKAYKKLDDPYRVDKCINYLNKIEKMFKWDNKEKIRSKLLLANCFMEKKEYIKAEKYFNEILNNAIKFDYKEYILMAYTSISALYKFKGDIYKAIDYIKNALKLNDIKYLNYHEIKPYVYFNAFSLYIETNNFVEVENLFFKTIAESECLKNEGLQIETYDVMINYLIRHKKDKYILKIIEKIELKKFYVEINKRRAIDILYKASYYFKSIDHIIFEDVYNKIFNHINNL